MLPADGAVPVFAAPFSYLLHLRRRRLPSVLSLGLQPPVPASGPRVALVVGEPEEVEGLPGAFFPHGRRGKVEEPDLPGVQRESVFSKALAQHLIHALGIALVAEAEQGVVRIMDEPHPASQHGLHIFTLWRHAATDLGSLTPRSLLECCSISWLDRTAAFCPLSTLHAALLTTMQDSLPVFVVLLVRWVLDPLDWVGPFPLPLPSPLAAALVEADSPIP